MLSRIREDAKTAPKTFGYKLDKGLATLADEEEACTKPYWAYWFALNIPGANIEKCQEAACKEPCWAYCFVMYIPGADKERCRRACERTKYAF